MHHSDGMRAGGFVHFFDSNDCSEYFEALVLMVFCKEHDLLLSTRMDHSPINQNFDLNKSRQNSIIA